MERYAGEVSNSTDWSVQRFCRQFLQADASPNYPDASLLRLAATQEYLYSELFAAGSCGADLLLPPGYVLKILKLLVAKIEESIDDWNQYVRGTCSRALTVRPASVQLASELVTFLLFRKLIG